MLCKYTLDAKSNKSFREEIYFQGSLLELIHPERAKRIKSRFNKKAIGFLALGTNKEQTNMYSEGNVFRNSYNFETIINYCCYRSFTIS